MKQFIDISNHQRGIDIGRVHTDALIVKATEGRGWRDREMAGFVRQARSRDKPLGFYHFVSQGNTPVQEADNLLAHTSGHRRDNDLLVLDWEPGGSNPGTRSVDWAVRWLEHIAARTANPIWTYMNLSTANGADWKPVTGRWPRLWLAHYPGNNRANGYRPAGNRGTVQGRNEWQLASWQFTDGGRLDGFGGNLDLNELYMPWWTGDTGSTVPVANRPTVPVIRENDPPVHLFHHHGGQLLTSRGAPRLGCICMALTFPLIELEMIRRGIIRHQIDVFQTGYNKGGVAASAGTHDMGGVIDVAQGITREQRGVWADFGVMMAPRIPAYGWRSGDHGHGGWYGCNHRTGSLATQVRNMMNGYDGLVSNIRRNFDAPSRTWQDAYLANAPIIITEEKEEVPHLKRTFVEFEHHGQTNPDDFDSGWQLPPDEATVIPSTDKAVGGDAHAVIHVPEGVRLITRWVSWSGRDDPGWVREEWTEHATTKSETKIDLKQAWGGADLRLDVWCDKPCKVWIRQTAKTWDL